MSDDKLNWSLNAARELAMDSAHIPHIQAIIDKHFNVFIEAETERLSELCEDHE